MCARILVAGGNGFIGTQICRLAAEAGHEVISLSRHGRPDGDASWMDRVAWLSANILAPEEWRDRLEGCDAVIHAVGIEREKPDEGLTYERMYRDSVEILAWEAEHAGVGRFVCISSSTNPPFRSGRYLESKREGEAHLRGRGFREAILRPSYVYGAGKPSAMLGNMLQTIVRVPGLRHTLRSFRPLHVEDVARAALRAAVEDGYEGVIDVDNIAYLANGHAHDRQKAQATEAQEHRRFRVGRRALVIGAATAGLAASAAALVLQRRAIARRRVLHKPRSLKAYLPWA